jgi:hypothetical protein
VDLLKQGGTSEFAAKEARVLFETLDFAFHNAASTTRNWDKELVEDIVQVLQYHTVRELCAGRIFFL